METNSTTTLSENFTHNVFNSSLIHVFPKFAEYLFFISDHATKKQLVFLFAVLFLIFLFVKRKRQSTPYTSYTDTLPVAQWIPYCPPLNLVILLYKAKQVGIVILNELSAKYGDKGLFSLGVKNCVGIADPNIIKKLLSSSNPGHLEKPRFLYDLAFDHLMRHGLIASDVSTWSPHRKVLASGFTYQSFPTYFKFINENGKVLVQSALSMEDTKGDGLIDNVTIQELIDLHSIKISLQLIMGVEIANLSDEEIKRFHHNLQAYVNTFVERAYSPILSFPPIWWVHPKKRIFTNAVNGILEFSKKITTSYRQRNKLPDTVKATPNDCLMERMIGSGFSDREIMEEIVTFLGAGHETVKTALDMLIFYLAGSEEHQKICRMEVDELIDSKEENLVLEDLSQLKHLERCIQESMRLRPTIPYIARDLKEPLKITENQVIPAGETVFVGFWTVHRNSEIYPDPEKFDPYRFLPENVKKRHPYAYLPFSMGVRNCIGWKVGMLEMKVIMTYILRNFEMTTTDGPDDVKMNIGVTLLLDRPYNVTFKKRRN